MSRFYFLLWGKWALRLTLSTFFFASLFTLLITASIYAQQGFVSLNSEVYKALFGVAKFWFAVVWNIALLLALFRGMKYIFNSCNGGYVLELFSCENDAKSELIEVVGLGDLVKVWRKWFMLIIWLVGAQMIFAVAFNALFSTHESIFDWFNIYVLYSFILVAGYFSFMILGTRCKQVRISRC